MKAHDSAPRPISSYAITHCTTCAAGWTRKDEKGGPVIVCLLDREAVWPQMVDCDRFEAKESAKANRA